MKTFENTFNAKFNKADKVQKRGFKSGLPISKARAFSSALNRISILKYTIFPPEWGLED